MNELERQLAAFTLDSPVQWLDDPFSDYQSTGGHQTGGPAIRLFLKRDDQLHPLVSGNKWRKLKYNLLAARAQKLNTLLTFGGAYSNHLYATAAAGRVFGFGTVGVVRGDELINAPRNTTLTFCESCGMTLHFVSRADFRRKDDPSFTSSLQARFGPAYVLPEGGTNALAIRGTAEIIPEIIAQLGCAPNYVCCPVGTGGTVAGLIQSAPPETTVLGFLALKAPDFQLPVFIPSTARFRLQTDYHFGGYAKTTPELLDFIRAFEQRTGILIEQVYTAKMLYGIYDLVRQGYFPDGATVVAVHTGGLQGRSGVLG
jgi:1-aminocyclopropane-1-carboxylate deaminase/D-cysteine desulfhydrase-like pyridoxal-dependent ACC family enzyme